ncbi:hypothetical protein IWX49DRAFT_575367 [Phyllosticta citricarpa]
MAPTQNDPFPAGGSITDMAVTGTTTPQTAGKQNTIPSVPRPDQSGEKSELNPLGAGSQAAAVDNATDIPRNPGDTGKTGGVVTGKGDQLPASVEKKHF